MAHVAESVERRQPAEVVVSVVDTDVHPAPRSREELYEYMPRSWRERAGAIGDRVTNAVGSPIYVAPGKAQRGDAYPLTGGPPCSDPEFAEQQLFGDAGVDYAILVPLTVRPMANPEHEAALSATTNAWLAETWLSKYNAHGRYHGSIRVTPNDPMLAAEEIEHWGGHPGFVQVVMVPYAMAPFGQPRYDPIYEAATRHDLPVGFHVNRAPGMALLTPVGYSSYYFEHHTCGQSLLYAAHLVSLLCEGAFERFPTLKVVFIEGGSAWLAPLLWRLDNHWEALRTEVPWLRRRPSEYVRDHVRFTTQPIEEPENDEHLARMLEWMDAEHILMFATDYPHWDGDYHPKTTLPRVPKRVRERILRDNALELYGLPRVRHAENSVDA